MLYICNKVKECNSTSCNHRNPHKLYCITHGMDSKCNCDNYCDKEDACGRVAGRVKCIPIFKDFIDKEEMEI